MKSVFVVSLCREGILGGAIYMDDDKMVYRTNKLTVSDKYRNLEMCFEDVTGIVCGRLFLLATVTINLQNKESYRFIVFRKKKFIDTLHTKGIRS